MLMRKFKEMVVEAQSHANKKQKKVPVVFLNYKVFIKPNVPKFSTTELNNMFDIAVEHIRGELENETEEEKKREHSENQKEKEVC